MPNPKQTKARSKLKKNIQCPRYDACLTFTALRDWHDFTCRECEHQDEVVPLDIMDMLPVDDGEAVWSINPRETEWAEGAGC